MSGETTWCGYLSLDNTALIVARSGRECGVCASVGRGAELSKTRGLLLPTAELVWLCV